MRSVRGKVRDDGYDVSRGSGDIIRLGRCLIRYWSGWSDPALVVGPGGRCPLMLSDLITSTPPPQSPVHLTRPPGSSC